MQINEENFQKCWMYQALHDILVLGGMSKMYTRRCPKCEREMEEYPALSRIDNKTEICETCGAEEALQDAMGIEKTPIKYETVKTILIRKPSTVTEVLKETKELIQTRNTKPETYRIVKTIELGFVDIAALTQNLIRDNKIIKEYKDLCVDDDMVLHIKEKGSDKFGILVDPDGADYCRHVGIQITEMAIEEFKKHIQIENEKYRKEQFEKEIPKFIKRAEAYGYKCEIQKIS